MISFASIIVILYKYHWEILEVTVRPVGSVMRDVILYKTSSPFTIY
jgi:hypothetical protein